MKLTVGITAAVLLLGACSFAAQHDEKAEGAQPFKVHCARCHGQDGGGNTPMGKKLNLKDLGSAEVQKFSDAELKHMIENGVGKMPPFKTRLKPEQVQDLVAHMRTLGK